MFICHCFRPSSEWEWVQGLEAKKVAHREKRETKSDLFTVMGCLLVTGHLLTAGDPFRQTLSAGISLFSLPQTHCSHFEHELDRESVAQGRNTGGGHGVGSFGHAASWLPVLPTSPPCARVCCLHGAWRWLQELCRFPAPCLEFLLGNINFMCLVFSHWAPAWSRRWTETTPGFFGCIGKIPDAGIKCLPRCAAEGRLPHTRPAASSRVPCPSWPPEHGFCRSQQRDQ